jgi:hypothetical protein
MLPDVFLPAQWDELAITRQLQQLRDQRPALIPHFVESVKERWILRQDDQTAEVRLRFLKTQIDQLKLVKEFQQTAHDIELLLLEKTKRMKSLQLETEELEMKRRGLSQKERLESLRDQKKMELEIAKLEKEISDFKTSAQPERRLTPEQQRANDKAACEARIQALKEEKQKALQIEDAAERVMRVNALDDAIQREYERWSKLL